MPVAGTPLKSQYHHFIPRFVLRNFKSDIQPPSGSASYRTTKGNQKSSRDYMINIFDLKSSDIKQRPISQELGLVDMYREPGFEDEHHLERKLSVLKSNAGQVIAKALRTFEDCDAQLALTRSERDVLRKFLFLMKYRNMSFYERYNHQDIESYEEDDKERMRNYMETKNFKTPKAVWFANIFAFLDLQMDAEKRWMAKIKDLAYPDNADMFVLHVQCSFMAFCKPTFEEEFLLPEIAFGVSEGPCNGYLDPQTGTMAVSNYIEYHHIAPISPTLTIVLRSFLLPSDIVDGSEEVRKVLYDAMEKLCFGPGKATSILQDLPVEKCRNSYSEVDGGRLVPTPGYHLPPSHHIFYFRCFQLSSRHINLLNSILLEEAVGGSSIVFRSTTALRKAIKHTSEILEKALKLSQIILKTHGRHISRHWKQSFKSLEAASKAGTSFASYRNLKYICRNGWGFVLGYLSKKILDGMSFT
jgi:hypothetical protein